MSKTLVNRTGAILSSSEIIPVCAGDVRVSPVAVSLL